jgi:Glycogen recognition site of AMP-activated protein kinase
VSDQPDERDPLEPIVATWYARPLPPDIASTEQILASIAMRQHQRRRRLSVIAVALAACALLIMRDVAARSSRRPPSVRFSYVAGGDVAHVALVSDFNGWNPRATPLTRAQTGTTWAIEVHVAPGPHAYAFVIDGSRWIPDPAAPLAPDDGLGGPTSIIVVEPRHRR